MYAHNRYTLLVSKNLKGHAKFRIYVILKTIPAAKLIMLLNENVPHAAEIYVSTLKLLVLHLLW